MTYCGFVSIIGRPNVGKSTLLNQLVGQKISITSNKPQTTNNRIIGIHTDGLYQVIYIDTPGIYIKKKQVINHLMNRIVHNSIINTELSIFVVEGTSWKPEDEIIVNRLHNTGCNFILAINKIDKIINKAELLPYIKFISKQINAHEIIPICAQKGLNIKRLAAITYHFLPESEHYFPKGHIINYSQSFMSSEIIREKLMRFLGDELPYYVEVEINHFDTNYHSGYCIHGLILVKRSSHKKIIIGNHGNKIKKIGIEARKDMESMFNTYVNLKLWVKIKS